MSISSLKDEYKKAQMQEMLDEAGIEYDSDDIKDDLAEIMLDNKGELDLEEEEDSEDEEEESSGGPDEDRGEFAGETIGTRDRIIERSREVEVNGRLMIELTLVPDEDTKTPIKKILSRKDVEKQINE